MRIAICEEDKKELSHLLRLIKEYQLSRGTGIDCRWFPNATDFLCDKKAGDYDLVLLDRVMQGISGLQAAKELRERDKNVRIVFLALAGEAAEENEEAGIYGRLSKPVKADSLFLLLHRAEEEHLAQERQGFVLKSRDGISRISFSGLAYAEVINKTVFFHLKDGEILEATASLGDFEEKLLLRPEFLKPHRSYLVNLHYVQAVSSKGVLMKNGDNIPVSRKRFGQVRDAYMGFGVSPETAAPSGKPERAGGPWQILLVDDDPAALAFWADVLKSHGCVVIKAGSGEEALKLAAENSCDCALLDVMIPGENGFSLCERLHRLQDIPVIFLSSLTEPDKQVEGFAAGGIDYITKDTTAELFWVKVEARIRLAISQRTQLSFGPLLLDLTGRKVWIDGRELFLTSMEFDILWCLSEHGGRIFSPEEIFGMFWGGRPWDGGQTVQVEMSRLRRKLEKAWGEHRFIETVWGKGYRFMPAGH